MSEVITKTGGHTLENRTNRYGLYYDRFYETWGKGGDRDLCWPHFQAAWGIAIGLNEKATDPEFTSTVEAYKDAVASRSIGLALMNVLMHEIEKLFNRANQYTWDAPYEDTEPFTLHAPIPDV